jgi:ABC-type multidrug transport system fused ATPase/permease subunit
MGLGMAILFSATLASYSLVFWFGSQCVEGTSSCPPNWNGDKIYTAGSVVTVVLSLLMAGFNLNQLVPSLKKIAEGRNAGARIYVLIDR